MFMRFLSRALVLLLVYGQVTFCAMVPPLPATVCDAALEEERRASPALFMSDCYPLHAACKNNDIDEIKRLLMEEEITPNSPDEQGNLPLHYSVRNRHATAVYYLLKYSKTPDKDKLHRNALGQAPYHMLLEAPIKRTARATTRGSQYGALYKTLAYLFTLDLSQVEKIVRSAVSVTDPAKKIRWEVRRPDCFGCPPLPPLHRLVLEGNTAEVERCLSSGILIVDEIKDGKYQAQCDERGFTPLMALAQRLVFTETDISMAVLLLAYSCDRAAFLAVAEQRGYTALHLAAFMNNSDAVPVLLEVGGLPFTPTVNEEGKALHSPFEMACAMHSWSSIRAFIKYFRAHGIVYDFPQTEWVASPFDLVFQSRFIESIDLNPVDAMLILQSYCGKRMAAR